MTVIECPKCGEYVYKVKTRRGKDLLLDTRLDNTFRNRFTVADDDKADFVDRFDQERGRLGYPSHYSTCKESVGAGKGSRSVKEPLGSASASREGRSTVEQPAPASSSGGTDAAS